MYIHDGLVAVFANQKQSFEQCQLIGRVFSGAMSEYLPATEVLFKKSQEDGLAVFIDVI